MHTQSIPNPPQRGAAIFAQGQFWSAGIVTIDEFHSCLTIPVELDLGLRERLALKLGNFPSFPAEVLSVREGRVRLQFVGPVHPEVIERIVLGEFDEVLAA
ncbi:MAG: hypothetical protein ABJP34_00490 [Erythrobacter sp.]